MQMNNKIKFISFKKLIHNLFKILNHLIYKFRQKQKKYKQLLSNQDNFHRFFYKILIKLKIDLLNNKVDELTKNLEKKDLVIKELSELIENNCEKLLKAKNI